MRKIIFITCLVIGVQISYGQKEQDPIKFAPLHLGITQGVGTNGNHDLSYTNNISINLLSGQSWANNLFCLSGISHFQVSKSQGIFLSGITNKTGGFPYKKRNQKDSLATINAIQIAGAINAVNGGGKGVQVSGIYNKVTRSFDGLQLSSVYNGTLKGFSGAQIGLLVNAIGEYGIGVQSGFLLNSAKNLSGLQLLGLTNVVMNDLDGLQLGALNFVGNKKSNVYRNFKFYWLQIGVVNYVRQNSDGTQIGLINYGKDVGFSQIGLINISKKIPQYPIGPLNIGGDAESFLRYSTNSLFLNHIEIGTGSKKLMNTIGYSVDPASQLKAITYSIGNQLMGGYKKREYFLEYNALFSQIKTEEESFLDPNPAFGARIQIGYDPFLRTKLPWMFFFVGCSFNVRKSELGDRLVNSSLSTHNGTYERWLDFHFGIQID